MEKYGFVYIWYDRKHKRYYIGSHWGTEDDGYICSSNNMRHNYRNRPDDFKRRTLSIIKTNRVDLLNEEQRWLDLISREDFGLKYYNINSKTHKASWWVNKTTKKQIKQKISIRTKEAMQREDVRKRLEEGLKSRDNRSSNLEVRKKRSRSMKETMAKKFPVENRSRPLTEEERKAYYSNKAKDMWNNMTEEQKEQRSLKLSKSLKGLQSRLGQTNSKEHRDKISRSLKGKIHKRHNIMIEDKFYESTKTAEKELNISVSTINRRLNSDNHPEWIRLK